LLLHRRLLPIRATPRVNALNGVVAAVEVKKDMAGEECAAVDSSDSSI
jgi:hypothetical protein